jgi:hypothetical protein
VPRYAKRVTGNNVQGTITFLSSLSHISAQGKERTKTYGGMIIKITAETDERKHHRFFVMCRATIKNYVIEVPVAGSRGGEDLRFIVDFSQPAPRARHGLCETSELEEGLSTHQYGNFLSPGAKDISDHVHMFLSMS